VTVAHGGLSSATRILAESNYDRSKISAEDHKIIESRVAALELALNNPIRAKYRLRLALHDSNRMEPAQGFLSFWRSSAPPGSEVQTLQKLYRCPGKRLNVNECERLLEIYTNHPEGHICPHCGVTWNASQMDGEVYAKLTRQNWAEALVQNIDSMQRLADLEITVWSPGVREANLAEHARYQGGEKLKQALEQRRRLFYPFQNILRDLSVEGVTLLKLMSNALNACSAKGQAERW
jgi:hypothetical protein